MRSKSLKRAIDIVGATAALLVSALPMIIIAVAVRIRMGRPVLFRQLRPGLGGETFELLKFRTMSDGPGTDAERLTRLGAFLRRTSLDELPELINVVRGQMSLVGPRPLLVAYLDRYTPEQARRHEMRPGITGLAQVSGRNSLGWEERFRLDVVYVDTWTLAMDARLLADTVRSVIKREGIAAEGHATMPEFLGTADRTTMPMPHDDAVSPQGDESFGHNTPAEQPPCP